MIIHIISTANGEQNEGMRNVATHLASCFEKKNTVIYSSLHDVLFMPGRCKKADCTMIFARCISKVYYIASLCQKFSRKLVIFLVQKPEADFISLQARHPLKSDFYTACIADVDGLAISKGHKKAAFDIGINANKFTAVEKTKSAALKEKYGFDTDKPLIIHVGHCSAGRGLEDLIGIDSGKYQRLIIDSGMFTCEETKNALIKSGVKIKTGYIENVNEIYQMADAYVFPTKDDNYVISIPLSVMEALSCGVPVIAYKSFRKLQNISAKQGSILLIDSPEELNETIEKAVSLKSNVSYLQDLVSWEASAEKIISMIQEKNNE